MMAQFKAWLAAPYSGAASMSAGQWGLFIGLILIIVVLWSRVIAHVAAAAPEVL